ncbi:MAG: hypothetical protein D6731_25140 [Planctomycetota bacterium]|nr:MAG: hypothetical protein D6731_25140 [Planctomycetota bacterium]
MALSLLWGGCAANQFYEAALRYEASQPLAALEYYKACLELEPAHEQARPRFDGQDFYAPFLSSAAAFESRGDFVGALGAYDQLVDVEALVRAAGGPAAPLDLVAKRTEVIARAAAQKFAEGESLRAAGDAKAASKAYRAAVAYDPTNAQARARYREQRAKATQRVAVLPFRCRDPRFAAVARDLSDALVARAIAGQPEFLQFVDRNHLDDLLEEHDLNASGLVDPSSGARTGRLLGLHALVYGTVAFECTDTGWQEEPGEDTVVLRHDDGKGNVTEETVSAQWVVCSRQTRARARAGYQVISVESGAILAAQEGVLQDAVDASRYARLVSGRVEAVPLEVRSLLEEEPREPQRPEAMVPRLVRPLGERLAGQLLRQFR